MSTSGPTQYDSYMQLAEDGDEFVIMNKLPLRKMYFKTADDALIDKEMERHKKERIKINTDKLTRINQIDGDEDLEVRVKEKEIELRKSSSSFRLSEVTSFTFGPFTSRFWMMRKHTLMMDKRDLQQDAPFYAWDCVTISINERWDVYLQIKCEEFMKDFLYLLIAKTQTIDGKIGTAIPFRTLHYMKLHS